MKPQLLYIAGAVIIGFSIAWFLKPSPAVEEKKAAVVERPKKTTAAPSSRTEGPDDPRNPREPAPLPSAADSEQAVAGPSIEAVKSRDEARMIRLAEALGLSKEQQAALTTMIEAAQASSGNTPGTSPSAFSSMENAITMGGNIEKSLDSILTPEQAEAFQKLRERNRTNQVETTAQKEVSELTGGIDLTPEQRQKALDIVRGKVSERYSSWPSGLELTLDTSVLPTGPAAISSESVDSMRFFAESEKDPAAAQAAKIEKQRRALDDQLTLYGAILSPGQMTQFRAEIDERKKTLDRLSEITK
jgi:hypothetical protein